MFFTVMRGGNEPTTIAESPSYMGAVEACKREKHPAFVVDKLAGMLLFKNKAQIRHERAQS